MQWLYLDLNQQQIAAEEEQLGDLVQSGAIQAETMLWNETMTDWQSAQAIWPDTFQAAPAAPTVSPPAGAGAPIMKRRGSKPLGRPTRRPAQKKTAAPSKVGAKTKASAKKATGKKAAVGRSTEDDEEINTATRRFAGILRNNSGWILFVAIMMMVFGVLQVIGGIAILFTNPHIGAAAPILIGTIPIVLSSLLVKAGGSLKLAVDTGFPENLDNALTHLANYFLWIGILLMLMLIFIGTLITIAIVSPGFFMPK